MKVFTDYYEISKVKDKKTRYDVGISTCSYPPFERLLKNRTGGKSIYLVNRPAVWNGAQERRADKALTKGENNISSLIIPDPSINIAYGDIKGTEDAMIVLIYDNWNFLELFISRGQKNNKLNLYQLTCDGEFDDEMLQMRYFGEMIDPTTGELIEPEMEPEDD